ncbi:zinc ribbon domain-containing protein [Nocardia sp. CA-145437]|uniref:zinc ribbon domain-containing protein n=1 Tax=Nocardia sp. CA-145437 TaxID=3239980 RepID=UPI003D971B31
MKPAAEVAAMSCRSYRLPSCANAAKLARVAAVLPVWQAGLGRAQSAVRRQLFTTGVLPRWVDTKGWDDGLSQRQWDSVGQQAVATHRSWLGSCERVFRDLVTGSTLPEKVAEDLLYVNKANAWYRQPGLGQDGAQAGQIQMSKHRVIAAEILTLARTIMRQVRKRVGAPDLRRVRTMVMDGKIAVVESPKHAGTHAYWVRISTLTRNKPVWIPLRTQAAFEARLARPGAVVANHCQVIITGEGRVEFRLVVKTRKAIPGDERTRDLGVDWGMATLFATSAGTLHGRDFLDRLRAYDARLQPLVAALNRQHIRLRDSRRYRALVQDIRGFVTNEVNRCLNRILNPDKGGAPDVARVIVEKLDFRGLAQAGKLSKRLRRLLAFSGRAAVDTKLASLREDLGIEILEVPAAYSSQECGSCGYTARSNRRTQARFRCRFCGRTVHADIGGARTLLRRSHLVGSDSSRNRGQVLNALDERFQSRWGWTFAEIAQRQRHGAARVTPTADPPDTTGGRQKDNGLPFVSDPMGGASRDAAVDHRCGGWVCAGRQGRAGSV